MDTLNAMSSAICIISTSFCCFTELTGGVPYPGTSNAELLPLLKRGYRMEKPDNCSSEL